MGRKASDFRISVWTLLPRTYLPVDIGPLRLRGTSTPPAQMRFGMQVWPRPGEDLRQDVPTLEFSRFPNYHPPKEPGRGIARSAGEAHDAATGACFPVPSAPLQPCSSMHIKSQWIYLGSHGVSGKPRSIEITGGWRIVPKAVGRYVASLVPLLPAMLALPDLHSHPCGLARAYWLPRR